MLHDKGFDYIKFLKRRQFIGPLITVDGLGLLVPVEAAIGECVNWSGQEISRKELLSLLKRSGVFVGNANDMLKSNATFVTKQRLAKESLAMLSDALLISANRIQSVDNGHLVIAGRRGQIDGDWSVRVRGKSRRHFSGIKRRLDFMPLLEQGQTDGTFQLAQLPTPTEAQAIRRAIGLKKRPTSNKRSEMSKNAIESSQIAEVGIALSPPNDRLSHVTTGAQSPFL